MVDRHCEERKIGDACRYVVPFGGDENVPRLDRDDGCNSDYSKTTELCWVSQEFCQFFCNVIQNIVQKNPSKLLANPITIKKWILRVNSHGGQASIKLFKNEKYNSQLLELSIVTSFQKVPCRRGWEEESSAVEDTSSGRWPRSSAVLSHIKTVPPSCDMMQAAPLTHVVFLTITHNPNLSWEKHQTNSIETHP